MKKNVIYVQREMLFIVYDHVNRADTHALLIVISLTMNIQLLYDTASALLYAGTNLRFSLLLL